MEGEDCMHGEALAGCDEACRMLGMRKSYVYDLASQGRLPSYRFGRTVRFKRSDLIAFREAHRQGGIAAPGEPGSGVGDNHGVQRY
jgi:excisionase family DNA binding protein